MRVFGFVVISLLAAMAAALVTGTRRPGCLATILIGILGWVIGGLVFAQLGDQTPGMFITAFLGASLFLLVARALGLFSRR
jgi:uncharacterized membrane protein YeaQ/YmgE (transglycosylase-associated protein family)